MIVSCMYIKLVYLKLGIGMDTKIAWKLFILHLFLVLSPLLDSYLIIICVLPPTSHYHTLSFMEKTRLSYPPMAGSLAYGSRLVWAGKKSYPLRKNCGWALWQDHIPLGKCKFPYFMRMSLSSINDHRIPVGQAGIWRMQTEISVLNQGEQLPH